MNVQPGGIWRYGLMPGNESGEEVRCKAIYKHVLQASKLVYIDTFTDNDWNNVEGNEMYTTVSFEDVTGRTKLSITTQFYNVEDLDSVEALGMIEGFTDTIDRLEKYFLDYK
jgi:uncharacterized protein YndB with AHSA1/START domain